MSADLASDLKANTDIERQQSPGVKFSGDVKPVPHWFLFTVSRFLEYCRPPFNEWDFLEVAGRIKSIDPDNDARTEAFHMGEYNRLRKELKEYVERNTPA